MQKIIPFLWFDNRAEEAVEFYISLFADSKILNITRYQKQAAEVSGQPAGSVMSVEFELAGQKFTALNGGPVFKFTPAISFFVNCGSREEVDRLWAALGRDGSILMALDSYPFSERYGWLTDRFGLSWQLNQASRAQKITPCLMFTGKQSGKAGEAMRLYTSLFPESKINDIYRYEAGENDVAGYIKHALFTLHGQEFMAMDSSLDHAFGFTPAISFFVNGESREEVDRLWEQLTHGGEEVQCGWLADRYGVSWQIVPTVLGTLLADPDPGKAERVMTAMLRMKKLDIDTLKQAYNRVT
jgi:predicted 3-demethylubiquinone-9 3-methyltransferase (glyoxalase superfamily)